MIPLPRRPSTFLALASSLALAFALCPTAATAQDAEPTPLFDGSSLDGWDGADGLWRVEDGNIVGQTTDDKKLESNSFLVWKGGEIDDFELTFEYQLEGGNSGVQIRSFLLGDEQPHRVGGYQADFDASNQYSGIIYGENYRGILAMRGQKTVLGDDGKPTVEEAFGDHEAMGKEIPTSGWIPVRVVAKGWTIQNYIDGKLTAQVTDEDEDTRRRSGLLAFQLHVGEPMKLSLRDIKLKRLPLEDKKKVVFFAGNPSHGYGAHEHRAGCLLLAKRLNENFGDHTLATVYSYGWPEHDPTALQNADALVIYCDGGGGHLAIGHLDDLKKEADRGLGIGCLHYAVEIPKGEHGDALKHLIGGYFETDWSVNPHWDATFDKFPDHPMARGLKPFTVRDEWYYHMRFPEDMKNVTAILTDLPPDETLSRGDGAHSGNPFVRKAVLENKEPQHVAWAVTRADGGRGFGFTGGHFHKNWADDNFRKTVLNGIAWIAGAEIPEGGVESPTPSDEELEANQDFPKP
ncbi:hypothetical protein BH23VER1_BH23VER1_06250 [soil metagenome]